MFENALFPKFTSSLFSKLFTGARVPVVTSVAFVALILQPKLAHRDFGLA